MKRFVLHPLPLVPVLLALLLVSCGGRSNAQTVSAPRVKEPDATVVIVRRTMTPAAPAAPSATPTPKPTQLCLLTRSVGIPATYVPPNLVVLPKDRSAQTVQVRQDAAEALLKLMDAARDDGLFLVAVSGYRSYEYQQQVLAEEIKTSGEAQARRQVAEPGHSEHQLGVAIDVATAARPFDLEEDFGLTPEGRWVAQNAARFGFVISYPEGKEPVTGYIYEPWHVRYVGVDTAQKIVASAQTLNQYLPAHGMAGCPPAPTVETPR